MILDFTRSLHCARVMSDSKVVVESAVHGFHVYGVTWNLAPGEQLGTEREPDAGNPKDSFGVCLKKGERILLAICLGRQHSEKCSDA